MEAFMNVTRTNSALIVESHFIPTLPAQAKKLGGRWDPDSKAWVFDPRDENRVAELYQSIYGYWDTEGEPPSDAVTVRVTANYEVRELKSGIFLFGRLIAKASGRDTGAGLGPGIIIDNGSVTSGGSRANWETIINKNATFEIKDVPLNLVDKECETKCWLIEIVTSPEREALLSEKKRLLERVDEIDVILESYNSAVTEEVTTA
jgi:hypothetical protein